MVANEKLEPIEVDLEKMLDPVGVIQVDTVPEGLRIELGDVSKMSPAIFEEVNRADKHTLKIHGPGGKVRLKEIVWERVEGDKKVVREEFKVDEPEPEPRTTKARSTKRGTKKTRRTTRRSTTKKPQTNTIDVWGGKKKGSESLDVWGGKKKTEETAEMGFLTILGKNNAKGKVYVNGRVVGSLPLNKYKIKAGSPRVKVKFTETGKFSRERRVKVRKGITRRLVIYP